jgi:hypothetical protein
MFFLFSFDDITSDSDERILADILKDIQRSFPTKEVPSKTSDLDEKIRTPSPPKKIYVSAYTTFPGKAVPIKPKPELIQFDAPNFDLGIFTPEQSTKPFSV